MNGKIRKQVPALIRPAFFVSPDVLLGALFVYHHLALWSMYRAGMFRFHDLTLITDWFTNAVYYGKPFFISDNNSYHLAYNFTPSLIILSPLYYLTELQYLTVFLGLVSLFLSVFVLLRIFYHLTADLKYEKTVRFFAALLVLICVQNRYTKTALISAHFEIYYCFPALLLMRMILERQGRPLALVMLLAALVSGIRQDAGLFLGFQALGLIFIRKVNRAQRAKTAIPVAVICFACVVVAVKFIMPSLGDTGGLRFWKHLGEKPLQIFMKLVGSPDILFDLRHSGLKMINMSFGYVHLLNPYALFANIPGIPLYLTHISDFGHRMLLLYNSSFLLPGFFLAVAAGMSTTLRFASGVRWKWARTGMLLACAFYAVYFAQTLVRDRKKIYDVEKIEYRIYKKDVYAQFKSAYNNNIARCGNVSGVATDHAGAPFLPNSTRKYLLRNFILADAVIFKKTGGGKLYGNERPKMLEQNLEKENFTMCLNSDYVVYVRKRFRCCR